MNSPQPIIELRDVCMDYGHAGLPALENINLDICKGDFLAISGPNGGGKTTLLRIILKLLAPTKGSVTYYDNRGGKTKHLHIGYLPQKSAIDTRFPITVREVIESGLLHRLWNRTSAQDRTALEETIEQCEVAPFLHKSIGELSGGQLQRTLLARAIISRPDVLVLDEPLSYVDKQFERQIYGIMDEITHRATIILVSHEMTVISGMANRHITIDRTLHT